MARKAKVVSIPSAHEVFKSACVQVLPHEVPEHWSYKRRKRDRDVPAMTPERARIVFGYK